MRLTADRPERLPVLETNPLQDRSARTIRYLRVSLTDRCNFRCTYCMPAEGFPRLPRNHLLSFEEQVRVVRLMAGMGVERIRLTGGEPLIRRDAVALVERLRAIEGIQEVAMQW